MNFELDDPLADILSGGSDDSFFDDDLLRKKKSSKKNTPIAAKKSALFNLDDDRKSLETSVVTKPNITTTPIPVQSKSNIEEIYLNKDNVEKPKTPVKSIETMYDSKERKENYLSLEKMDAMSRTTTPKKEYPVKKLEKQKSSISLLDDILGPSITKPANLKSIPQSKSQELNFDELLSNKTKEANQKTSAAKITIPIENVKPEKPKTPSAKLSKSNSSDWLGIFNENKETKEMNSPAEESGMPTWLVGKAKVDKRKTRDVPKTEDVDNREEENDAAIAKPNLDIRPTISKIAPGVENMVVSHNSTVPLIGSKIISNEDLTQEGAALYMQQQESQLMVALQLKAQEEKLAAIQQRQEESRKMQQLASVAQHSQLSAMLETQAAQRNHMQAVITAHQERINQRIKALLAPVEPEETGPDSRAGDSEVHQPREDGSPRAREKRQLLQLVQTLQENHDKEIDLMETSYRRQLAITDVALAQSEERLRVESERLRAHYTERLDWAEVEARAERERVSEEMKRVGERHERSLREERTRAAEAVALLREHHTALLDNIKSAISQERTVVADAATLSAELGRLLTEVREGREEGRRLAESVREVATRGGEEGLNAVRWRENQVKEMLQQLSREREVLEKEKSEERETLRLLEARLRQMTQGIEEDASVLKQRRMELEFERATFAKQTEFAKNVLKKQDEEVKMLKEEMQKDCEERLKKIEEEKSRTLKDATTAAKEKAHVNSLKQELEKLKATLQAQVDEASEERSRLAMDNQQLRMEEQRMLAKSRDLDMLAKAAVEKQSLSDQKYAEAEHLQRKYEERIRRLQEQVLSLNTREKLIAREKVALSRERLALHNEKKQLDNKQCSLCRSAQSDVPFYGDVTGGLCGAQAMAVSRDYGGLERDGDIHGRDDHGGGTVEQGYQDVLDPKLLLLRLDVQQVINNLSHARPDEARAADQGRDN